MANVLASYISNGTDRASIMNALRLSNDGRTITLFSTDNEEFTSSVNLPEASEESISNVEHPVKGVYNIGLTIPDNTRLTDCTSILQDCIDKCAHDGGGVVRLGSGTYVTGQLVMKPKVALIGNGECNTILKQIVNGVSAGASDIDGYNGGTGFIQIPVGSTGIQIKDMTILGTASIATSDEADLQISGVTTYDEAQTKVNGIHFLLSPLVGIDASGNPSQAYRAHQSSSEYTDLTPYKHARIENVSVIGFTGSGIVIGSGNTDITISNVVCDQNRYDGLIVGGHDISISNLNATGNGQYGVLNAGANNRFSNIICQFNGKYTHLVAAGFKCDANTTTVSGLIVSRNWCTGLQIQGSYNNFANIIADANGGRSSHDSGGGNANPMDVPQVLIPYGKGNTISATILNTIATETIKVASKPLVIYDDVTANKFDFIVDVNAGQTGPYIMTNTNLTDSVYGDHTSFGTNTVSIMLVS